MTRLIAVARGDAEPDTVIEGARVFSAFTREWLDGRRRDRRRADRGRRRRSTAATRVDGRGKFLVPGFIDAHVHLESAKLTPGEFARAVVPRGTTAVVCDPHEIANVAGVEGVDWLLAATDRAAAGRLRDGAVVRAGLGLRVAARAARAGGDADDPATSAGARRGRDDELPGRHRGRSGRAGADRRAARRRARARGDGVARWTPTWPPGSRPTTRRSRPRRRWRSAGAGCGC